MGFFSWKTMDTNKSISNESSNRPTFKVVMKDNKGNKWVEENYEGYGLFGGKDYYQLLAEMNGLEVNGDEDHDRGLGIDLIYGSEKGTNNTPFISPSLSESENYEWSNREHAKDCEYQGYFY